MIELQPWAMTTCYFLLALVFHFSGWMLAAPVRKPLPGLAAEGEIYWKFIVGCVGTSVGILALIVTCIFGKI
jgi:hypothetical protein